MKMFIVASAILFMLAGCITGVQVQTEHGAINFNDKNQISAEIEYEGATIYIEDNEVVAVEIPNVIVETN